MSVTIDPQTGWPVKPTKITRFWYVVVNAYCDSRTYLEANSQEELDTMYEEGRSHNLYGSIYEGGTRQGYDPEAWAEYESCWMKIWRNSCIMPPEEDLRLTSWAKRLPPERWEEIVPELGKFVQTRTRRREIKDNLFIEYMLRHRSGDTSTQ
jgi:hypothetical protein